MSDPSCWSGCCPKIRDETRVHCREFSMLGMSNVTCQSWVQSVGDACDSNPCSCTAMGKAMYAGCEALTRGVISNPYTRQKFCQDSRMKFETTRCASSCQYNTLNCFTDHGAKCGEDCSDYQECKCFTSEGLSMCDGTTITELDPTVRTLPRRCSDTPLSCRWDNEANSCLKQRWCPLDMCLLKNVQCVPDPVTQPCVRYGACSPFDGICHWVQKDDGTACDDGIAFTVSDVCHSGECIGRRNQCKELAVECVPSNPCLKSPGFCSDVGNICIYELEADGTECGDDNDSVMGSCVRGVCVHVQVDMCANLEIRCDNAAAPVCYVGGRCDPKTGFCDFRPMPDGSPCDDRNNNTLQDNCVEGICIGVDWEFPEFRSVLPDGVGCTDEQQHIMNYYQAEDKLLSECKEYCEQDGSCSAIAYSLFVHSCKMYSNLRQLPLDGWIYVANGDSRTRGRISHAISSQRDGDPTYSCYIKVGPGEGDRVEVPTDPNLKAIIFFGSTCLGALLLWWLSRRRRRWKTKTNASESIPDRAIPDEKRPERSSSAQISRMSEQSNPARLPPLPATYVSKLPAMLPIMNAESHTMSFMTEPVELS